MELITDIEKITPDNINELLVANKINPEGNYSVEKIINAIAKSFLVVSAWNESKLVGFCRIISDGIYYGRIQELMLHPEVSDKSDAVTEILKIVFSNCPKLNGFHLNPSVYEKKEIYKHKHFNSCPQLRKLYWSIHEDEF